MVHKFLQKLECVLHFPLTKKEIDIMQEIKWHHSLHKCFGCLFVNVPAVILLEISSWCTFTKNSGKPRLMWSVLSASWEVPHEFYKKA